MPRPTNKKELLELSAINCNKLLDFINELPDERKYQWTGTTSLGAYLISATSSHYDWG